MRRDGTVARPLREDLVRGRVVGLGVYFDHPLARPRGSRVAGTGTGAQKNRGEKRRLDLVVVAALGDADLVVDHLIDESVLVGDPP